jgi:hypothetical protein
LINWKKAGILPFRAAPYDEDVGAYDGNVGAYDGDVGEYDGDVGEYDGDVGEYDGDVGEYDGDVGEYDGDVGEYDGDVGEYDGDVGEKTGAAEAGGVMLEGDPEGPLTVLCVEAALEATPNSPFKKFKSGPVVVFHATGPEATRGVQPAARPLPAPFVCKAA